MKIYLASAYGNWAKIRAWAVALRALGVDVVSTWHDLPQAAADPPRGSQERGLCAAQCLSEVHRSGVLIFFDSELRSRGGLVELGAALGVPSQRVIWAELWGSGASANVFDSHYRAEFVSSEKELLEMLGFGK